MITTIYDNDKFLEHHGVKGMKWGVRKQRERAKSALNSINLEFDSHSYASTKKHHANRAQAMSGLNKKRWNDVVESDKKKYKSLEKIWNKALKDIDANPKDVEYAKRIIQNANNISISKYGMVLTNGKPFTDRQLNKELKEQRKRIDKADRKAEKLGY